MISTNITMYTFDGNKSVTTIQITEYLVNSEIFMRISFSGKALKDIFAMLKIHDNGMIYLDQ